MYGGVYAYTYERALEDPLSRLGELRRAVEAGRARRAAGAPPLVTAEEATVPDEGALSLGQSLEMLGQPAQRPPVDTPSAPAPTAEEIAARLEAGDEVDRALAAWFKRSDFEVDPAGRPFAELLGEDG